MDSHLTYQQHVNYVYGKAARKLGYLTFLCSHKGIKPSLSVYNLLYKTIIRPGMEYGCAFWNAAAVSYKSKLDRIQRIAMCKILGVMQTTAYDTVNILTQVPPLEFRRRQEEVKLYHRCIKMSTRFPTHNLVQAYSLWKEHRNFDENEYISWRGKLSTLSRAYLHADEVNIPTPIPDSHPLTNIPPMFITNIPTSIKSPFRLMSEPSSEQILASLTSDCVVIFTDGSATPNPGIGGAAIVVQDPSLSNWLELEFPIKGITTNIGCEIEAMKQALEYTKNNLIDCEGRIIILSDCKFVVNAVTNKCKSEDYRIPIMECQKIIKSLKENNVPEIYWIKGHIGIPGNERADQVAKRARFNSQINQPELYIRPNKIARFLNRHGLNPYFTREWNRHWINEGNEKRPHQHPKSILSNIIEAQSFEKFILHNLTTFERKIITRLITGKVGLNKYLFSIKVSLSPFCNWCQNEYETVEHFLLKCSHYQDLRRSWFNAMQLIFPHLIVENINLKFCLVGNRTIEPNKRINLVKLTAYFVRQNHCKIWNLLILHTFSQSS